MKKLLSNELSLKKQDIINEARILIVDDEAIIRDGCEKILLKEGWNVQAVENGLEALELIKNKEFDLLLLDLMMPGMNGLDVIPEVNKIAHDVYIIVITGYATVETAVEAMKRGAYDYIPKPFTPDQLRVVVKRTLENKALLFEAEYLRKEQEKGLQAIAQEKSKIKTILNCMPNGVLVLDSDKRVVLYNPMAGKLLNLSGEESTGKLINECIDCSELSKMINEVLNNDSDTGATISGEISEDDSKSLMAHTAPVTMEDNEILGAVTILQDITEQKAIDKMKADFIAKVTHELKAPAATMNQLLMAIQTGAAGELGEKQKEIIERVKLRGEGLLELISDLLDISKIESGLVIQKKVPLCINEIVEEVVDLLKPQSEVKQIIMNLHLDDKIPLITADKDGIREVFTNLINNAIKYTHEGGKINIKGEMNNDYFIFSVSDNGIGISKKNLAFIFERFFRVKNNKTRYIIGTGLGLPIVKEIVDAHLGSIEVKSEEGKGSAFKVLLPRMID